jgi:hypothetical protein
MNMATLDAKTFDSPEETRPFAAHGRMEIVHIGDLTVGRGTFEPGWKWSADVKPIANTPSCQSRHAGYIVSGRMVVRMDDGTEAEAGPGAVVTIEPGHDACVVGNDACVFIDFGASVGNYAASGR